MLTGHGPVTGIQSDAPDHAVLHAISRICVLQAGFCHCVDHVTCVCRTLALLAAQPLPCALCHRPTYQQLNPHRTVPTSVGLASLDVING